MYVYICIRIKIIIIIIITRINVCVCVRGTNEDVVSSHVYVVGRVLVRSNYSDASPP